VNDVSTKTIIVGISKDGESEGALLYAVEEAKRQHCGITVVHAMSESLPPPPGDPLLSYGKHAGNSREFTDQKESTEANRLVTDVARRVRAMSNGSVPVDAEVPVGRRAHAIIEAAADARLIVLQHHDLSTFERIFVRSTSTAVSARARCPVVTVPPVWDPDLLHNRVTVAIDKIEESEAVLRLAFESAKSRGSRLDVVHTWKLISAEEDIVVSQTVLQELQSRTSSHFERFLAPWQEEFPQVTVEHHVIRQETIKALLEYSRESDLLVLGRFRAAIPLPLPLGTVARAMVNHALCPVEVVPHGHSDTSKAERGSDDASTDKAFGSETDTSQSDPQASNIP